ncbi:glycosyl hydrolase family 28-related protein [Massilia sp.]|uniref:right-handed parallel beta-helix repeat-containing protein n=1 Tax=Massilia sp. TaxID=1882437 RepID=UPI00352FCB9F
MQAYQENISAKVSGVLSPVLGVQVTVTDTATGNPAALYSDNGVTSLTQPLVTDETGYFGFYAANGDYELTFASAQVRVDPRFVQLYDPDDDAPLTQQQAAAATGASKIGIGTETVENALNALQLPDYAALRAYAGPRKSVYVAGSGIAGMFVLDAADTTTADNGGTVIVSSGGKRRKRAFDGYVNVKWFGAKGDGISDDTAAFEAALSTLKRMYVPAGSYNISRTLVIPHDGSIVGDGMTQSIINSNVIGGSLFTIESPNGAYNSTIQDLQLNGNGLTGSQGNGHALNLIDPTFDSGAWSPQGMTVQRLWIRNFRGNEDRGHAGDAKIASAGVICVQGLQNVFRDVIVHSCGHGFYLDSTQTNKIVNCVAYLCDKAGIFTYKTDATVIEQCDIVGNGASGTTDTGYPSTDLGMANVISNYDETLVISRSKFKNTGGTAQLYLKLCHGAVISENWIRSNIDPTRAIVVDNGIKALKCAGIRIKDNTFSCVLTSGTADQGKAKHVNLVTDSISEVFSFTFTGNIFVTQSGLLTEYSLCVEGISNSACQFAGAVIDNNRFGTPGDVTWPIVVDDDILVRNCSFTYSRITNNVHYAQASVTRTRCINGTGLSAESNNTIQQNLFKANGGTITANYSGFLYPTKRRASKTYDPPSLTAAGTAGAMTSTTFSVNNAIAGEPVTVYFNKALLGVVAWGEVTSNTGGVGTVTVYMANTTNATVDLPSGSLGVVVDRTSSAELN